MTAELQELFTVCQGRKSLLMTGLIGLLKSMSGAVKWGSMMAGYPGLLDFTWIVKELGFCEVRTPWDAKIYVKFPRNWTV